MVQKHKMKTFYLFFILTIYGIVAYAQFFKGDTTVINSYRGITVKIDNFSGTPQAGCFSLNSTSVYKATIVNPNYSFLRKRDFTLYC